MKSFNKISLRMRITILAGAIFLTVSLLLTFMSMYNAQNSVVTPFTDYITYLTVAKNQIDPIAQFSENHEIGMVGAKNYNLSTDSLHVNAKKTQAIKINDVRSITRTRAGHGDEDANGLTSIYRLKPTFVAYGDFFRFSEQDRANAIEWMEKKTHSSGSEKETQPPSNSVRKAGFYNIHVQIPEMAENSRTSDVGSVKASQIAFTAKKNFNLFSVWSVLVLSVIGMLLIYFVSGMAMKPVVALTDAAEEITGDQLKRRIPVPQSKDEIGKLTRSFNGMLDRLETSFNMQKQFSSNVAHELKTPLATIKAGIQVLHLDTAPTRAEYEEVLHLTQTNVNRLLDIVDDLMDMCNDRAEDYSDELELKNVFRRILSELEPALREKDIRVQLNCEGQETVKGNKILLYRALFNLVENAVKYNKEGGSISIQTAPLATEVSDAYWRGQILISDTGMGIPQEDMDRIFEPFYRVEKSRNRKIGGAGLGLSLVKTILEKHGWQIQVKSQVSQGTQFVLTVGDR